MKDNEKTIEDGVRAAIGNNYFESYLNEIIQKRCRNYWGRWWISATSLLSIIFATVLFLGNQKYINLENTVKAAEKKLRGLEQIEIRMKNNEDNLRQQLSSAVDLRKESANLVLSTTDLISDALNSKAFLSEIRHFQNKIDFEMKKHTDTLYSYTNTLDELKKNLNIKIKEATHHLGKLEKAERSLSERQIVFVVPEKGKTSISGFQFSAPDIHDLISRGKDSIEVSYNSKRLDLHRVGKVKGSAELVEPGDKAYVYADKKNIR